MVTSKGMSCPAAAAGQTTSSSTSVRPVLNRCISRCIRTVVYWRPLEEDGDEADAQRLYRLGVSELARGARRGGQRASEIGRGAGQEYGPGTAVRSGPDVTEATAESLAVGLCDRRRRRQPGPRL